MCMMVVLGCARIYENEMWNMFVKEGRAVMLVVGESSSQDMPVEVDDVKRRWESNEKKLCFDKILRTVVILWLWIHLSETYKLLSRTHYYYYLLHSLSSLLFVGVHFLICYVGLLVVVQNPRNSFAKAFRNFIKFNFRSCFTENFYFVFLQGIFHRIGDTFMRLKKWSEAERFHRAALEAEPNHIPSHISYGTMLARNVSCTSQIFSFSIFSGVFSINWLHLLPYPYQQHRVVDHRRLNNISNEQYA